MKNQKLHSPKVSQVIRLFLLCTALIDHAPFYVLAQAPDRSGEDVRVQGQSQPQAQSQPPQEQNQEEEEREIVVKHKNHPALEIKGIRNFRKKTWLRDLEIEVTNVSNKPIYYLSIFLLFPDVIEGGRKVSETFDYGNSKLVDWVARPSPDDLCIKPGDSYTFKLSERRRKELEPYFRNKTPDGSLTRKIELHIENIRFGDGTGFFGGGTFFRSQPKRVSFFSPGSGNESFSVSASLMSKSRWKQNVRYETKSKLKAFPDAYAVRSDYDVIYCPDTNGCYDRYRTITKEENLCYKDDLWGECRASTSERTAAGDPAYPCMIVNYTTEFCRYINESSAITCSKGTGTGCGPDAGNTYGGEFSKPADNCGITQSSPHYVCYTDSGTCQPVNSCGQTQSPCSPEKAYKPCCDNGATFSFFECDSNGDCQSSPNAKCTFYPCTPPPPPLPGQPPPPKCAGPSSGGGDGSGGDGGGYGGCTYCHGTCYEYYYNGEGWAFVGSYPC